MIDIGDAVVEMILELSRRASGPAAHTGDLAAAAERVSKISGWLRSAFSDSRWLYPDGTPPNGWEP